MSRSRTLHPWPHLKHFIYEGSDGTPSLSSTGGFTKDAKYEADRGSIPVVLLDLDDLSNEIVRHYVEMDMEARSLISLTTILWPT